MSYRLPLEEKSNVNRLLGPNCFLIFRRSWSKKIVPKVILSRSESVRVRLRLRMVFNFAIGAIPSQAIYTRGCFSLLSKYEIASRHFEIKLVSVIFQFFETQLWNRVRNPSSFHYGWIDGFNPDGWMWFLTLLWSNECKSIKRKSTLLVS